MNVIIGSARIDEFGKISGGAVGDQKQTSSTNDMSGEVSIQNFYAHSKGWIVIRPKDKTHAAKIAERMIAACNNANIGYDQSNRTGVIKYGIDTKTKTECDCSALVRACVKEATGKDPGNFTTANESSLLSNMKMFEKPFTYKSGDKLYTGDILVTSTKGHTAIVVKGEDYVQETKPTPQPVESNKKISKETKWKGSVTAFSLNVRTWAGTENPKCSFGPLKKGNIVDVCDSVKASDGVVWYYIRYNGKYGFVSSNYIKKA